MTFYVKCLAGDGIFTSDKFYRVTNKITSDQGFIYPKSKEFSSFEDLQAYFSPEGYETFGARYSKNGLVKFEPVEVTEFGVNIETVNALVKNTIGGHEFDMLSDLPIAKETYYNFLNGRNSIYGRTFDGRASAELVGKFINLLEADGVIYPTDFKMVGAYSAIVEFYVDFAIVDGKYCRQLKRTSGKPNATLLGGPIFERRINIFNLPSELYINSSQSCSLGTKYAVRDMESLVAVPYGDSDAYKLALKGDIKTGLELTTLKLEDGNIVFDNNSVVLPLTYNAVLSDNSVKFKTANGKYLIVPRGMMVPFYPEFDVSDFELVDVKGNPITKDGYVVQKGSLFDYITTSSKNNLQTFDFRRILRISSIGSDVHIDPFSYSPYVQVRIDMTEDSNVIHAYIKDGKLWVTGLSMASNFNISESFKASMETYDDLVGTVTIDRDNNLYVYRVFSMGDDDNANITVESYSCRYCGNIHVETFIDENGYYVCPRCHDQFVPCRICGAVHYPRNNRFVCSTCLSTTHFQCGGCGGVFERSCMHPDVEQHCQICGNTVAEYRFGEINGYGYKPRAIMKEVPNDTSAKYFGVELEVDGCRNSESRRKAVVKAHTYKSPVDNKSLIYCKSDGSLDYGFEMVTHPMSMEYIRQSKDSLKNLFDEISNLGFKSHNTTTCGLHVHTSMTQWGSNQDKRDANIAKAYVILNKNYNFVLRFTRRKRESLERWASMLSGISYSRYESNSQEDNLKDAVKGCINSNRYVALNIRCGNTVEFRIFRGTLKMNTFMASVQFCELLIEFVKTHSLEECVNATMLDILYGRYEEMDSYLRERNLVEDNTSLPADYANTDANADRN